MSRPLNILQMTTHDSGRHFGCYGHPTLHTPAVDALAADGVRFANAFAVVPICGASRASMLTGCYPQTHGLMDLPGAFGWRLHDPSRHLASVLRRQGYRTLLFGFQHEAPAEEQEHLGFDQLVRPGIPPCDELAEAVSAFLCDPATGSRPFYAQVGLFETHTPFSFGGAQPDPSKGIEIPAYLADDVTARAAMAGYQGAIRKADAAVGRILEALRDSRLEEQTLVVVTTDHGLEMPRAKWTLYDAGIAIAMILRGPQLGLTGGRIFDGLFSNVDYLPTLLDLVGLPRPDYVEGISAGDALRGVSAAGGRDAVFGFYHKNSTRCVRTQDWKLIRHFDSPVDYHRVPVRWSDLLMKRGIRRVELFDLRRDPHELRDLSADPACAVVVEELDGRLWSWMERVRDPLLAGPVRSPSYEAALADYARWRCSRA